MPYRSHFRCNTFARVPRLASMDNRSNSYIAASQHHWKKCGKRCHGVKDDFVHTTMIRIRRGKICRGLRSKSKKKVDAYANQQQVPLRSRSMSNTAIMKRIAELCPVLPRPTAAADPSNRGPIHVPSSVSAHAHPQRHHRSGQAPYELAYGMMHQQHMPCRQSYTATHSNPAFSSSSSNDQSYTELQMMGLIPDSWNPNPESIGLGDLPFPSLWSWTSTFQPRRPFSPTIKRWFRSHTIQIFIHARNISTSPIIFLRDLIAEETLNTIYVNKRELGGPIYEGTT